MTLGLTTPGIPCPNLEDLIVLELDCLALYACIAVLLLGFKALKNQSPSIIHLACVACLKTDFPLKPILPSWNLKMLKSKNTYLPLGFLLIWERLNPLCCCCCFPGRLPINFCIPFLQPKPSYFQNPKRERNFTCGLITFEL